MDQSWPRSWGGWLEGRMGGSGGCLAKNRRDGEVKKPLRFRNPDLLAYRNQLLCFHIDRFSDQTAAALI